MLQEDRLSWVRRNTSPASCPSETTGGAGLFLHSPLAVRVDERRVDGAQLARGDNSEEDPLFIDRKPIKNTDK